MASVEHVIVLMLENNSFDRVLGDLLPERPGGGGVKGTAANHWNDDTSASAKTPVRHVLQPTTTRVVQPDPNHEHPNVLRQMAGPSKGYVTDLGEVYPSATWQQRQEIMGVYPDGYFPALHTLAKEFTVCDRWFSAMPGPTWPNRAFVHTGTSLGYTTNSVGNTWNQTTVYELLSGSSISWKVYHGDGDISQTVVLQHAPWVDPMRYFYRDAQGQASAFPRYCFIEPHYGTLIKSRQNDQHPRSDVVHGDALIRDVYNAIRSNTALWQSSLLIILYDEHGGFYDHVDPPAAVPPDNRTDASHFKFDRLGPRVPAVLVSPWLDKGVISDTFDHTSILSHLVREWNLSNLLGDRVASPTTNSFKKHFRKAPRSTYGLLPKPATEAFLSAPADAPLTDHQQALVELAHQLATRISDPSVRDPLVARAFASTPQADAQLATEQFRSFLIDQAKNPAPASPLPKAAASKSRKPRSPGGTKKKSSRRKP